MPAQTMSPGTNLAANSRQTKPFALPPLPDWRANGLRRGLGKGGAGLVSALLVGGLFSTLALIEAGPLNRDRPVARIVAVTLTPAAPAAHSAPARRETQTPMRPNVTAPAPHSQIPQAAPVVVAPAPVPVTTAAAPAVPTSSAASPTADAPPAPRSDAPVAADLGARLVAFSAPTYPIESRRQREQGVVALDVLLDPQGRVARIAVARSSGSDRLDRAALDAVKRWRWAPLIVDGAAAMVRGEVRIPFVLRG
jgi:protein TonB